MRSGPRIAAGVLLGVLLAQAAWIVAVPPFRGIDEFDHAYRAIGVADGQWRLSEPARDGRGLLVDVPADVVEAAEPQCADLPYIEAHTCAGDRVNADGTVRVVTSAANYPPVFYFVVGLPSGAFHGANSLYAMRAMSAGICALLLALAALCLWTWSRGPWAIVGLLVAATPTLVYSTTLPAPNGAEMAAGLLLWTSLLGIASADVVNGARPRAARLLVASAGLAAALLAGLRTTGPLWALMILAVVVATHGWRGIVTVCRRHRVLALVGVVSAATIGMLTVVWLRSVEPFGPGALNGGVDTSWTQIFGYPRWILGSIGAFPFKDQPAPLVVHLLVLMVLTTGLVAALRTARGRARRGLLLATLLCFVVPSVLVAVSLAERGGHWQGRYALPFAAGVAVLIGARLDESGWLTTVRDPRPQVLALVMVAIAHVVSVVHVQLAELGRDVSAEDPGWVHPSAIGTGLLMAIAWLVLGATALSARADVPVQAAPVPPATTKPTPS